MFKLTKPVPKSTKWREITYTDAEFREIGRALEEFSKNTKALERDWRQLLEQFPNEWVAYHHQKLVGHDSNLETLIAELKEKGIWENGVATEYLNPNPPTLIL